MNAWTCHPTVETRLKFASKSLAEFRLLAVFRRHRASESIEAECAFILSRILRYFIDVDRYEIRR